MLVFGSPLLAAAISLGVLLFVHHFGPALGISRSGGGLLGVNAAVAAAGAAAGGLLVREELLVRLFYAFGAGLCGVIAYYIFFCTGALSLTALMGR